MFPFVPRPAMHQPTSHKLMPLAAPYNQSSDAFALSCSPRKDTNVVLYHLFFPRSGDCVVHPRRYKKVTTSLHSPRFNLQQPSNPLTNNPILTMFTVGPPPAHLLLHSNFVSLFASPTDRLHSRQRPLRRIPLPLQGRVRIIR